jgi:hypothetical protein
MFKVKIPTTAIREYRCHHSPSYCGLVRVPPKVAAVVVAAASLLLTLLPFCTGTVGTFTKDAGISGGMTGANTSPGSRDW